MYRLKVWTKVKIWVCHNHSDLYMTSNFVLLFDHKTSHFEWKFFKGTYKTQQIIWSYRESQYYDHCQSCGQTDRDAKHNVLPSFLCSIKPKIKKIKENLRQDCELKCDVPMNT